MKAFLAICDEKSFTKASQKLYISQSSLSKIVKNLEKDTNALLLNRTSKKVEITEAGWIFYNRSKEILSLVELMDSEIKDLSTEISGEIKIGLPQIIGTVFFSNIAKSFLIEYPKVNFNIVESGGLIIEKMIEEESIDIGLCVLPTVNPTLDSQIIFEDLFVICVSTDHKFSHLKEVNLDELVNEDFIMFDKSFALNRMVTNACRNKGFIPNVIFESTQWDFILELVSFNIGIAIIPKILFYKLKDNNIVPINISNTDLFWQIGIVTKNNTYKSKPLLKLVEVIKNIYL